MLIVSSYLPFKQNCKKHSTQDSLQADKDSRLATAIGSVKMNQSHFKWDYNPTYWHSKKYDYSSNWNYSMHHTSLYSVEVFFYHPISAVQIVLNWQR